MMKLDIGIPDNKGGCKLFNTFGQALEKIKIVDALTLGVPKIVYLVGWQYLGHDSKYPAFFEVNEFAKRKDDKTALESLLWLIEEAKKHHTIVSFHINFSDAYKDSPLWNEYIENNLILRRKTGRIKPTGKWNGVPAYGVRFKEEFEKGYFQNRFDKLCDLLPLKEIGTVHVDAFFVRNGKNTTIKEEKLYRRKMIEYCRSKGVDVTSEFIYREKNWGFRSHKGESDTIGIIPAVWNLVMTQQDYLNYPPNVLSGGALNMDLQRDKDLQYLFYGNDCTEPLLSEAEFDCDKFIKMFATSSIPYLFLNEHKRLKVLGKGKERTAFFGDCIKTFIKDKSITEYGKYVKKDNTLCIKAAWLKDTYYAYSDKKEDFKFDLPTKNIDVYFITKDGIEFYKSYESESECFSIPFSKGNAFMVKLKRDEQQ